MVVWARGALRCADDHEQTWVMERAMMEPAGTWATVLTMVAVSTGSVMVGLLCWGGVGWRETEGGRGR